MCTWYEPVDMPRVHVRAAIREAELNVYVEEAARERARVHVVLEDGSYKGRAQLGRSPVDLLLLLQCQSQHVALLL